MKCQILLSLGIILFLRPHHGRGNDLSIRLVEGQSIAGFSGWRFDNDDPAVPAINNLGEFVFVTSDGDMFNSHELVMSSGDIVEGYEIDIDSETASMALNDRNDVAVTVRISTATGVTRAILVNDSIAVRLGDFVGQAQIERFYDYGGLGLNNVGDVVFLAKTNKGIVIATTEEVLVREGGMLGEFFIDRIERVRSIDDSGVVQFTADYQDANGNIGSGIFANDQFLGPRTEFGWDALGPVGDFQVSELDSSYAGYSPNGLAIGIFDGWSIDILGSTQLIVIRDVPEPSGVTLAMFGVLGAWLVTWKGG